MSHSAKALVLHCIDFRFVHDIVHFMKSVGLLGQYDDVAAAGAAKNLADPYDDHDRGFVLRQIAIARKLHGISQVYVINHLDCGAYGHGTFANVKEENERHLRDLRAAKNIIEKRFDGLVVIPVLARIDEQGKVDFERML
ncbi:MAG: carbonic anhydrase [Candidatus Kerfeldbacteria bacterium]|nr:carbonic anhydrase [Candidatus Kerfeldbacteria bacterium]